MKHYHSLIKLKKREADGLRKQLSHLDNQRDILTQLLDTLEQNLEHEVSTAGDIIELGVFFGDYSENIKEKQDKVNEQVASIDKQRDVLINKIFICFSEQKKFEIALAAKLAEQAQKQQKTEQETLDELAAFRHGS